MMATSGNVNYNKCKWELGSGLLCYWLSPHTHAHTFVSSTQTLTQWQTYKQSCRLVRKCRRDYHHRDLIRTRFASVHEPGIEAAWRLQNTPAAVAGTKRDKTVERLTSVYLAAGGELRGELLLCSHGSRWSAVAVAGAARPGRRSPAVWNHVIGRLRFCLQFGASPADFVLPTQCSANVVCEAGVPRLGSAQSGWLQVSEWRQPVPTCPSASPMLRLRLPLLSATATNDSKAPSIGVLCLVGNHHHHQKYWLCVTDLSVCRRVAPEILCVFSSSVKSVVLKFCPPLCPPHQQCPTTNHREVWWSGY